MNLIDVPGHRNHISDMIAGASKADVAVLICSAKKGELESGLRGQTYEHLVLARCIGVDRLVVAVNKMDHESVNWDPAVLQGVETKIGEVIKKLRFASVCYVPISAYDGSNVVGNLKGVDMSLLDILSSMPAKPRDGVTATSDTLTAQCLFFGNTPLIACGYTCHLHTRNSEGECSIESIEKAPPFIRASERQYITIKLLLDRPIELESFVVLRDGHNTIAAGKIISTN